MLLDARLGVLLAKAPAWLSLQADEGETGPYAGQYLRLGKLPFGLGREIGRGEEAIVYELIDLRTGLFDHVVKLCRHRPGTGAYARWAVPVRFQRNSGSQLAEIELMPSRLVSVEGGAVVKLQRYISAKPETDWLTATPIAGVIEKLRRRESTEAERLLDALFKEHGEKTILLDIKAHFLASRDQLDEALDLLQRALAGHTASQSSSRYRTSVRLAEVMEAIYQRDRSKGDLEVSLTLDDGTVLRNTFFSSAEANAKDDTLQDRSLFSLIETLGDLPYFVGGLNFIQESLIDIARSYSFHAVTTAVTRVDPDNPLLLKLRERGIWSAEGTDSNSGGNSPPKALASSGEVSCEFTDLESHAVPEMPVELQSRLKLHDDAYIPDAGIVRTGNARMMAAISDMYRGDDEAAERNLREALSLDRHNSEIWIAFATFLSARGRAGEAANVLRSAIGELEETGLLRLLLASTLLRSGSVAEAEIVLLRAQPLLPDRQNEIHQMLAEVSARKS